MRLFCCNAMAVLAVLLLGIVGTAAILGVPDTPLLRGLLVTLLWLLAGTILCSIMSLGRHD